MRIQHNIPAMSSYRNYMNNSNALSKNLEKLSSGYRINRAGDDAAGLAISEKMRAQISGLDQAQRNVNDGISLVKTAEGALQEVHDMLNRMVTLATQSANGTYDSEVDRSNLQKEVDALQTEIDRIADSSNFNGIKLLDGSLDSSKVVVSESTLSNGATMSMASGFQTTSVDPKDIGSKTIVHRDAVESVATKFEISLDNLTFDYKQGGVASTANISLSVGGGTVAISGSQLTEDLDSEDLAVKFAAQKEVDIGGVTYNITSEGNKLVFTMSEESLNKSTLSASFNGSFNVSVTCAAAAVSGALLGGLNTGTNVIDRGTAAAGEVLANTQITLNETTELVDGASLKIGEDVYMLAMSDKTMNGEYGENVTVVDLRDLAKLDDTDGKYKLKADEKDASSNVTKDYAEEAVLRLKDAAADNAMFSVNATYSFADATGIGDITLTFQEKSNYDGDVKLETLEDIEKQLQISTEGVKTADVEKGSKGEALSLQIGDTADEFNQLKVDVKDMHSKALGVDKIDISNQKSAAEAVDKIRAAINNVSATRGTLGATQNRLEHTNNNLSVMAENIQNAESTIRDTDVADEMTTYTKNNILLQAAQAMLAQANQMPQGVLQLLG